eukprot:6203300-Pleurochrysis_carterae.AAC.1
MQFKSYQVGDSVIVDALAPFKHGIPYSTVYSIWSLHFTRASSQRSLVDGAGVREGENTMVRFAAASR